MKLGKSLWLIIAVKLFIFFVVMKWLFFPNYLETNFKNDSERSAYILQQLTKER